MLILTFAHKPFFPGSPVKSRMSSVRVDSGTDNDTPRLGVMNQTLRSNHSQAGHTDKVFAHILRVYCAEQLMGSVQE